MSHETRRAIAGVTPQEPCSACPSSPAVAPAIWPGHFGISQPRRPERDLPRAALALAARDVGAYPGARCRRTMCDVAVLSRWKNMEGGHVSLGQIRAGVVTLPVSGERAHALEQAP